MHLLKRYWSDRSGATALFYGIVLIPTLAFVGVAVDYSRMLTVQTSMQNAIDMASLAGGRAYENTLGTLEERKAAAKTAAEVFFAANFDADDRYFIGETELLVEPSDETVDVSVRVLLSTTFLNVIGIRTMDVGAKTQVKRSGRGMELILVMVNLPV